MEWTKDARCFGMRSLRRPLSFVNVGRTKDFISNWRTFDKRKACTLISFLREIRPRSEYKIIQIPLDISVRTVLLGQLIEFRDAYGHVHYFTKDVAIQMLKDVGYEVIDYVYTWQANSLRFVWNENKNNPRKLARKLLGFTARGILGWPSRIFFSIHRDLAARVMGQWRLLVLAR